MMAAATATCAAGLSLSGGSQLKVSGKQNKLNLSCHPSKKQTRRNLAVCAARSDRSGGGASQFVAGFVLGGAICGTLAYIFAPEIRKTVAGQLDNGTWQSEWQMKHPPYEMNYEYEDDIEETRQTLNDKLKQLNSAIDKVYTRLKRNFRPSIGLADSGLEAI